MRKRLEKKGPHQKLRDLSVAVGLGPRRYGGEAGISRSLSERKSVSRVPIRTGASPVRTKRLTKFLRQEHLCLLAQNSHPNSDEYPSPVQLDGMDGYELFAVDKADKKKITHLTILFEEDGGYFILMATYKKGAKQAVTDVKAIMETFRRQ